MTQRQKQKQRKKEKKKDAGRESTESEASELHQKEAAANMQVGAVANLKFLNTDCCRYFVFFAIAYLVLWESYTHLYLFYTHGLADRAYGL